jgi:(p)ppGpp synthase/HD superfamily hydrolase
VNVHTAMHIANEAHAGQRRADGLPYITHPAWVAGKVSQCGVDFEVCAWLHDVIEDTDLTMRDLRAGGISGTQSAALVLLTHWDAVPYMAYIQKIARARNGLPGGHIAYWVKRADIAHNMGTLNHVPDERRRERMRTKYTHALACLGG